jgi:hypothetical protein
MRYGAAALAAAACVAGCGVASGNGVAAKSPDAIVGAGMSAISDAKSVHVSASARRTPAYRSIVNAGLKVTLELAFVPGKGGSGWINLGGGMGFQVASLDHEVYIRASNTVWIQVASAPVEVAHLLGGKWVRVPASGEFGRLANFVQARALLAGHGPLRKGRNLDSRWTESGGRPRSANWRNASRRRDREAPSDSLGRWSERPSRLRSLQPTGVAERARALDRQARPAVTALPPRR